jgi:hypothetical protein
VWQCELIQGGGGGSSKFDASCVFCRCRRKRVSAGTAPGGLGLTATQVMLGALLGALGVAMGVLTLLPSAPTQAVLAAALIFSGCKLRADKGLAPAPPLACRDAPLLAPAGGVSGGEESAAWGGGGRQQLRACSILITGANSGE